MYHLNTAEMFWDYRLEDDSTAYGGIGYEGETVGSFCKEVGLGMDTTLEELNNALVDCGIRPIRGFDIYDNYF